MPDEVGGFAGGTSCRDFAGIVPASRGAHCRPLHPGLASLCSGQDLLRTTYLIVTICSRAATGARSKVHRHNGEEAVQVEIESGTQVASRGPTWRIATPRY